MACLIATSSVFIHRFWIRSGEKWQVNCNLSDIIFKLACIFSNLDDRITRLVQSAIDITERRCTNGCCIKRCSTNRHASLIKSNSPGNTAWAAETRTGRIQPPTRRSREASCSGQSITCTCLHADHKLLPWPKKSLQLRNSWAWSTVQSCDIVRYPASVRQRRDSR